jgi:hypothetical protein
VPSGFFAGRRGALDRGAAGGSGSRLGVEFVVLGAGGRPGCCGINQISKLNRMANLGYWVRSSETAG